MHKIPWAQPDFWGLEETYLLEALHSSWISGGPFVERLESEISAFSGVTHSLAVSNGTTAIHLAFMALDLKPGDEVVVPGFCYLAAANIALQMGMKPVFAEVDRQTYCVTAEAIEAVLTPRTRLIVVVHSYGNVCDMADIMSLARSRGIDVLEDAAESFASQYKDSQSGSIGDIGTYSFQATKTITSGEGGMVLTRRDDLAHRMKLFRSHGVLGRRYWHEVPGHNFRLTNLQAALACAQLVYLSTIAAERARVRQAYADALGTTEGIHLQEFGHHVQPVLWALALDLDVNRFPQGRNVVIEQLAEQGIETRNGFFAASQLTLYGDIAPLPTCEILANNVLSLPTFPSLTDEQIKFIASSLISLRN